MRGCSKNNMSKLCNTKNIFSSAIIAIMPCAKEKQAHILIKSASFFGFQQDNQSLTQKQDEIKFVLG